MIYLYNVGIIKTRRNNMSFIDGIKERAKKEIKTIVLPEADR